MGYLKFLRLRCNVKPLRGPFHFRADADIAPQLHGRPAPSSGNSLGYVSTEQPSRCQPSRSWRRFASPPDRAPPPPPSLPQARPLPPSPPPPLPPPASPTCQPRQPPSTSSPSPLGRITSGCFSPCSVTSNRLSAYS